MNGLKLYHWKANFKCFGVICVKKSSNSLAVILKTWVIPNSLPVLSTEPVLRKAAVDRGLRFSTEQYGFRQRNDFVKCAVRVLFYCMLLHVLGSIRS